MNYKDMTYRTPQGDYTEIWTDSTSILMEADVYSALKKKL